MTENVVEKQRSTRFTTGFTSTRFCTCLLFLIPATALNMRKGVGLMEVLILIAALCFAVPLWRQRKDFFGPARYIILAFAFNLVCATGSLLRDELIMSWIDNSIRQLIIAALIGLIVLTRPKSEWLWKGLIVGAVGAGLIAIVQRFVLGMVRADGFHMPILFGDIAMSMGVMSLVSIPFYSRTRWACLPWLAFGCGVLASILSGTRGGWAAILLAGIPLYTYRASWFSKKRWVLLVVGCAVMSSFFFVPQMGVMQRVEEVAADVDQYVQGNADSSSGARLEMWRGAWMLVERYPLIGVGRPKFQEGLQKLIADGKLNPTVGIYRHAHNEFLNALATEGIIGALALLGLYLAPLAFFRGVMKQGGAARPYALAGVLLVISFVYYGFTQVMFAHHLGVAFYALMVCVLVGVCVTFKKPQVLGRP